MSSWNSMLSWVGHDEKFYNLGARLWNKLPGPIATTETSEDFQMGLDTVLPAKSDSGVMFCWIIHKWSIDSR